ncbi:Uncharacterised protein [Vibrio cholerae]|nr:Uncharacterised protein [Vibrio cholerae]
MVAGIPKCSYSPVSGSIPGVVSRNLQGGLPSIIGGMNGLMYLHFFIRSLRASIPVFTASRHR